MLNVESGRKPSTSKKLLSILLAFLIAYSGLFVSSPQSASAAGEEILIEPSSWGVVTAKELNAFKAYMRTRPLPTTNEGNKMVWGAASGSPGTDTEALGIMYELTEDGEVLDMMITFVDEMLKNRNDPDNGRMIFTGKRELCWPNKSVTDQDATYAGPENGNIIMHIANCAKYILKTPSLWDTAVPVGDKYGYGITYKERALKYIEEIDKTVEDFIVPNFIDATKDGSGLPKQYFPDTEGFRNAKHVSPDHPGRPIPWNQQMLLNNGFMALAECHELLGDKPDWVAKYDDIVKTSVDWFMSQLTPKNKNGHDVYEWNYWPDDTIPSSKIEDAGDAHASNDTMGLYRAYLRGKYGVPAEVLTKIADTLNYVVWDEQKQQFNFKIDGTTPSSESMKSVLWSEWIPVSEFNIDCYNKIVNDDWLKAAKTGPHYAARTFWMEKRLKTLKVPKPQKPAIVPQDMQQVNLALGKTYGASTVYPNASNNYIADKAFDGNKSSRWGAASKKNTDQYIYVDFGAPTTYNMVVVSEYEKRTQSYKLQSSDNGINYVDIPGTKGTMIGSEKVICFMPVSSRYLRLYIDVATKEPSIYELGVYNSSTISPSVASFDKKERTPETVMFRLVPEGRTLRSISNGGYSLVAGKDYTSVAESVYNEVYTITNQYLESLAVGEYFLNFDFATGKDAAMRLTVMDTSPTLGVSNVVFDKKEDSQADIPIVVNLNGNTLLESSNKNHILKEGKEYTSVAQSVDSAVYSLKKEYLATLPMGISTIVFAFDYGKDLSLNIDIKDTTFRPVITTIEVSGTDSIAVNADEIASAGFAAVVKDQSGAVMSGETVTWAVYDAAGKIPIGLSIDSNGILSIVGSVAEGQYTVKAVSNTDASVFGTKTLKITIVPKGEEQKKATTIEISGVGNLSVKRGKTAATKFTAVIKDQFGAAMNGETVTWAVCDAADKVPANVSINTNGELSIASGAAEGRYTIKAVSNTNTTVTAAKSFDLDIKSSDSSSGGGAPVGGGSTQPQTAVTSGENGELKVSGAELNTSTKTASAAIDSAKINEAFNAVKADANGSKTVTINVEKVSGAQSYEIKLPAAALAEASAGKRIEVKTENASVLIPTNMLKAAEVEKAANVSLTVTSAAPSTVSAEAAKAVGNRPVIDINLKVDGVSKSWNSPGTPVTVTIPYKPTAEELKNPESLVAWSIDGSGNPAPVYDSKFAAPDRMVFTAPHLNKFAIAFNLKTFADIAGYDWAKKQIEVLAAKGIIQGTSTEKFSPEVNISRADFVTLLVKTLNLSVNLDSNFDDVSKDEYYYETVGIAKKLGITDGVGNNKFNPQEQITRQDMMTLTAKALKMVKKMEANGTAADLKSFADANQAAAYAVQSLAALYKAGLIAGDGSRLNPENNATRAEVAVFMYRILNQ